jgi:hypothetical protein
MLHYNTIGRPISTGPTVKSFGLEAEIAQLKSKQVFTMELFFPSALKAEGLNWLHFYFS